MTTTTATTATPRQTAGNCPALARIKKTFNAKVYAVALQKMNEEGIESVRAFIREFFNDENKDTADEIVDGVHGGSGVTE